MSVLNIELLKKRIQFVANQHLSDDEDFNETIQKPIVVDTFNRIFNDGMNDGAKIFAQHIIEEFFND